LQFQICRHTFTMSERIGETYTEIYLHNNSVEYNKPVLKGDGTPFITEDVVTALRWLDLELSKD
jgi:hypothetical protein